MDKLPKIERRPFWQFICPVCKAERRSTYWPSPRPQHYIGLFMTTVLSTMLFWKVFHEKGVVLGFIYWALFEFFYRARARQSLICPHCGFDPYLYKHDVKLARSKIEKFFEDKNKEKAAEIATEADDTSNPKK